MPIITDENHPIQAKTHKHRIRRPCSTSVAEGRKFFDWSIEILDVNINYNYNYNCGGAILPASNQVQAVGIGSQLNQKPHHGNGVLGLGLLPLLLGTGTSSSGSSSSSSASSSASAGVASPPERPDVTEVPQDDVLPDRITQLKPGSYATASNQFFGSHTYNLSSRGVLKKIDRGVDWLLQPLWDLL